VNSRNEATTSSSFAVIVAAYVFVCAAVPVVALPPVKAPVNNSEGIYRQIGLAINVASAERGAKAPKAKHQGVAPVAFAFSEFGLSSPPASILAADTDRPEVFTSPVRESGALIHRFLASS
jgi:hypothetical protein